MKNINTKDYYMNRFAAWRMKVTEEKLQHELRNLEGNFDEIEDMFSCDLKFGTSGLRGIMAVGTNRINVYVIRRVTQGFAQHILNKFKREKREVKGVAISYDSRNNSYLFAQETARVLVANGIPTYIFKELMPVSTLSFAIREMELDYGIMITASHNSRIYNGYKVYDHIGCQILCEEADEILEEINTVEYFDDPKTVDFNEAFSCGLEYISDKVVDKFLKACLDLTHNINVENLSVLYTPLNGTGLVPLSRAFKIMGIGNVDFVEKQKEPSGDFPYCPKPNPEKEQVYRLGIAQMKNENQDILIATDPDCDRMGAATKNGMLTGNQIAALLFQFLCLQEGEKVRDKVVIRSIVSSPLIDAIADDYGVTVEKTLIGFKYIGEKIEEIGEKFVFGFEEGNGYLAGTHTRDKDGVSTAMLFAEMVAFHKNNGNNVEKTLKNIYKKYGFFKEKVVNYSFDGISGNQRREDIMNFFRGRIPTVFEEEKATSVIDYLLQKQYFNGAYVTDKLGLPKSNILEYHLDNGRKFLVRPSGTEPLLKVYIFAKGKSERKAEKMLEDLEEEITEIIYQAQM